MTNPPDVPCTSRRLRVTLDAMDRHGADPHRSPPPAGEADQEAWVEIDLLTEAMIAGGRADRILSVPEIDALLGVAHPTSAP